MGSIANSEPLSFEEMEQKVEITEVEPTEEPTEQVLSGEPEATKQG